jgi:hypothetical protein
LFSDALHSFSSQEASESSLNTDDQVHLILGDLILILEIVGLKVIRCINIAVAAAG